MNSEHVTILLAASAGGDAAARSELYSTVYQQLRQLARQQMRQERAGHTLQPTALVNEAFLRLTNGTQDWENRKHFFLSAASAMRRILIDHARAHRAVKRGSGGARVTLMDADAAVEGFDVDLLDLEKSVSELEKLNERLARVVELRYFVGFSIPETADALETSEATIKRDWTYARAWLIDRMGLRDAGRH